jgi:hypothetical protein
MTATFYQQNVYVIEPAAQPGSALFSLLPLALALAMVGFGLLLSTWLVSLGLMTYVQSLYVDLVVTCISLGMVVGLFISEVQQ